VCKLTRRSPNAVAGHGLKPQVGGTTPRPPDACLPAERCSLVKVTGGSAPPPRLKGWWWRREFNRKILRGKPTRCRVIPGRPALLGWRGRPRPSRTAPLGMTKTPTLLEGASQNDDLGHHHQGHQPQQRCASGHDPRQEEEEEGFYLQLETRERRP